MVIKITIKCLLTFFLRGFSRSDNSLSAME